MGHELPDSAPDFEELCERAPTPETVSTPDDCVGGINVHTCYPKVIESLMVVGERQPDSVESNSRLVHYTDGRSVGTESAVEWNRNVVAMTLRSGPAEECPVCMGEADPAAMLDQVIDQYNEHFVEVDPVVERKQRETLMGYDSSYVVYLDTGLGSNSTRGLDTIVSHNPYFDIVNVSEVNEQSYLPIGGTIRVELGCRYPDPMPGCPL